MRRLGDRANNTLSRRCFARDVIRLGFECFKCTDDVVVLEDVALSLVQGRQECMLKA